MAATNEPGLVEVTEGTTPLLVPRTTHTRGPKKREGTPFYNPAMRIARDVSVLVLRTLSKHGGKTFRVRATDTVGNPGSAQTFAWVVDTVAPTVAISMRIAVSRRLLPWISA